MKLKVHRWCANCQDFDPVLKQEKVESRDDTGYILDLHWNACMTCARYDQCEKGKMKW